MNAPKLRSRQDRYLAAEKEALSFGGADELRGRIESLMCLGSYANEEDDITMDHAMMKATGALLRAVSIALACGSDNTDLAIQTFSAADGARACAAIGVLLEQGAVLIPRLRFTPADDGDESAPESAEAAQ